MQRILLLAGLIWALCLLGFFSARSISSGLTSTSNVAGPASINFPTAVNTAPATAPPVSAPIVAPMNATAEFSPDAVADTSPALSSVSDPDVTASLASSTDLSAQSWLHPASQSSNLGASSPSDQAPNANVRQQVSQSFPDADAATIDAWTETLQDLPSREIAEILMQKKALSGSLDALLPPSLQTNPVFTPPPATQNNIGPDALTLALRRNLQNAYCSGYRRLVVLPKPVTTNSTPPSLPPAIPEYTQFWSFQPGRCLLSPMPLHVSLGDDPTLMFQLEGHILTRRGDFTLLPDRRIGLTTPSGPLALANSPKLPENARRVSIDEQGRIQFVSDHTGPGSVAGTVSVVRVIHPEELRSDDGVHFTCEREDAWQTAGLETVSLKTRQIELSNVDPASEQLQLETLPAATEPSGTSH